VTGGASADDKPKPEDIVAKHLDSIGTAEARKPNRPRGMTGTIEVTIRSKGVAKGTGAAILASEGAMNLVRMDFGGNQYPYDRVAFDGGKITASQVSPGVYSNLGSFVRSYPELLKDGLLGGSLSTAWLPLNSAAMKGKLEYAGTKKVNNRPAIELRYRPSGGSDLKISLFFDAETFHHVRSIYQHTVSSQMSANVGPAPSRGGGATAAPPRPGSNPAPSNREGELSASQSETRYVLSEDFDDFKPEGGLTLPHSYKIRFEQAGGSSQFTDWEMKFNQFFFDQPLEAKFFDVSGN
jgi:hypothetical protein